MKRNIRLYKIIFSSFVVFPIILAITYLFKIVDFETFIVVSTLDILTLLTFILIVIIEQEDRRK